MVCFYCGNSTQVYNSRLQKQVNNVWRRRKCLSCAATFSTIERIDYTTGLLFVRNVSHIIPFSRDQLFASIYEACKHRSQPVETATGLTDTVLSTLLKGYIKDSKVGRDTLVSITSSILKNFDNTAYTFYLAYHPLSETITGAAG